MIPNSGLKMASYQQSSELTSTKTSQVLDDQPLAPGHGFNLALAEHKSVHMDWSRKGV
jgi:hypothetical protein